MNPQNPNDELPQQPVSADEPRDLGYTEQAATPTPSWNSTPEAPADVEPATGPTDSTPSWQPSANTSAPSVVPAPSWSPEPTEPTPASPAPTWQQPGTSSEQSATSPQGTPAVPVAGLSTDELIAQHNQSATQSDPIVFGQKRRKRWVLPVIVVAALVVLVGLAFGAYAWYETPDRVVADSLSQLIGAKSMSFSSNGSITSGGTTVGLNLDGAANQQSTNMHVKVSASGGSLTALSVQGDLASDKDGNYYFRVANIKDLVNSALNSYGAPAATITQIDQAVASLDNKWIKVTPDDLNMTGDTTYSSTQACMRTAFGKIQSDASYRNELSSLYNKQRFLVVQKSLGSQGSDIGYQVGIDVVKERAFADGLNSTKLGADLKQCDASFSSDSYQLPTDTKNLPVMELWANRWNHSLTKLTLKSPSTVTDMTYNFTLTPKLNQAAAISVPQGATDIKDLMSQLQSSLSGLTGTTTTSPNLTAGGSSS